MTRHRVNETPGSAPAFSGAGFLSLIELLVAMAIAAMVIATALSAVSGALRAGSRSQGHVEAALIARSQLALAEVDAVEGESSGEQLLAGRVYTWRVTLTPYDAQPEEEARPAAPKMLAVNVEVTWGEPDAPRSVSATTLLIAASPADR